MYINRVVLNYETKSKRNERNETKYYETKFVSFPKTLIVTEFVKYRRYKLVGEPAQN
jgi:hypothetical protein